MQQNRSLVASAHLIGTTGIWFAAPIGYILGIIPLLIYYYSGRWKKLLTVPAAEPAKA